MKKLMNIRINEDALKKLTAVAGVLEIPYSQLVREAIREKTDRILRENPSVKKAVSARLKN